LDPVGKAYEALRTGLNYKGRKDSQRMLIQVVYTTEQLVVASGIILLLILIIVWVVRGAGEGENTEFFERRQRAARAIQEQKKKVATTLSQDVGAVRVLRGGAFVGNRMRFKTKVLNESEYTITDVTVHLVSYPRDALLLETADDDVHYAKIEPGAFRSPAFEFIPTQDCVKGDVVAGVSYVDYKGKAHSLTSNPYVIRAVCDLLMPDEISPQDFEAELQGFHSGDLVVSVEDWTPQVMYERAGQILEDSNFHTVTSKIDTSQGVVEAKIEGWAKGKYTGKRVGVQLLISGPEEEQGASCTIRVSGEDDAMVVPALEDLRTRLCTWICPKCKSTLSVAQVNKLRKGGIVECAYCGASIGR
jgi:hypothetical protein